MAELLTQTELLLAEALELYGTEPQVDMMIEEMSELTHALLKHRRKRGQLSIDSVVEEMADVQIMLWQMELLFCCPGALEDAIQQKIDRLKLRMGKK